LECSFRLVLQRPRYVDIISTPRRYLSREPRNKALQPTKGRLGTCRVRKLQHHVESPMTKVWRRLALLVDDRRLCPRAVAGRTRGSTSRSTRRSTGGGSVSATDRRVVVTGRGSDGLPRIQPHPRLRRGVCISVRGVLRRARPKEAIRHRLRRVLLPCAALGSGNLGRTLDSSQSPTLPAPVPDPRSPC